MKKLQFKTEIKAPREKVWNILWSTDTYTKWTLPFSKEASYAITDWKKGSKVLFVDDKGSGMVSRIEENMPYQYMSIAHLGEVKDGVEDTESDKVKAWAGCHENYTLKEKNGGTELIIDMDVTLEFEQMFDGMWPRALAIVKNLSEQE